MPGAQQRSPATWPQLPEERRVIEIVWNELGFAPSPSTVDYYLNLCNYDVVRAGRGIVDEVLEAMGHELDWVAQEHKLAEQPQAPLPSILCLRSRSRASTQRQGVHHTRQGARTDAST